MNRNSLIPTIVLTLLGGAIAGYADVVTDWNVTALNAIRTERTPPPRASRGLAMLHSAIFDAVNGIKQPHEEKFASYFVKKKAPPKSSEEAAVSAAARAILTHLHPAQQATFDAQYAAALAGIQTGRKARKHEIDDGIKYGTFVANAIIALRADDGATNTVAPPTPTGPGSWLPTPPASAPYVLPQWAFLGCFSMTSPSQFRPAGPPALNSAEWAADYNEVKAYGARDGSIRTADQSQIALFWADGGGTETPPGHWNSIARQVAAAQGNTMDENARLFALINIAMADAAICAWDAKYHFNFWRPITAIQNGDLDGNDATEKDAAWVSFIVTPPFPDYTSGHSTFSGAASTVLAMFYGTDNVPFTTGSDFLPGVTRSFARFSAAAEEAALSRLYGGIHYRSANEDGLTSGLAIGEWTFNNYLRRKGHHRVGR